MSIRKRAKHELFPQYDFDSNKHHVWQTTKYNTDDSFEQVSRHP